MRRQIFIRVLTGLLVLLVSSGIATHSLRGRVFGIAGAALVLAGMAAFVAALLANSIARPFKELLAAFRRMAAGDYTARVQPRRGAGRELADDFNEMAFRTGATVEELKRQRETLDTVISSIREGLVVIDSTGRVTLANETLCRFAGCAVAVGRYYWEVIREPEFADLVNRVEEGTEPVTAELDMDGRVFTCIASRLASTNSTAITLHDITEISRSARLRRDFVVSASHELRTPLTAMKGYIETLEETTQGESRQYVEVIRRHTDRLVNMVNDLLALSELEEKVNRLEAEPVDLGDLASDVVRLFERTAQDKTVRLELQVQPGLPLLKADPFRLEQVIVNLVDNAVRYTDSDPEKRGEVLVSVTGDDKKVKLAVSDNGIGIAPEHIPRIFERFYVVDRSRSRSSGGTGLGLAIVKHIAMLHNGDVMVESTPGSGTTFTVSLPLA